MQLNKLQIILSLILCSTFVDCTDYESTDITLDTGKTPIELGIDGIDSMEPITRAVITDGTGKTLSPFTAATRLFLYMKSEDANTDDAHTHTAPKYALTYVESAAATSGKSTVTTPATQQLYWDDAHSRCSKLTVYALAVANKQRGRMDFDKASPIKIGPESGALAKVDFRTTTINPTFDWAVGGGDNFCSQNIFDWGDLVFSNNIADNTTYSKPDGRMDFDWNTSSPTYRKFDKGDLIFYHALSKVTFHVVMGEGFTETDFKFNTNTNIKLQGFNGSGLFDLAQGEFTTTSTKVFNYIAPENPTLKTDAVDPSVKYYEVYSYLVPGTDLKNSTEAEALTLLVNNNKYVIPMSTLYDKILAKTENQQDASTVKESVLSGGTKMKAGVNYLFTITVGKTRIKNITAQVVDWENVEADNITPTNARIKLQLEERGTAQSSDVAFYKANDNKTTEGIDDNYTTYNWKTGYTNLNATYSSTHWTTNYFWESNKDFYHFRALMPASTGVTIDGSGDGDYATLTSAASYTDVRWGAPMLDDGNDDVAGSFKWHYGPTSKGFDAKEDRTVATGTSGHQIYKAIGPTEDPVKLILFHMMSDLTFNINTTNTSDKVELCHEYVEDEVTKYKRTRLELVGFFNGGKVLLGSGLVKTTGSASTTASPVNIPFGSSTDNTQYVQQVYTFGAVPQDLTAVKLYITTPDNNQYIVDMKDVKATTVSTNNIANPYTQSDGKYIINRWYPGFKYTYTFTLKKKGIVDVQATIVDWENVTAGDDNVQIQ